MHRVGNNFEAGVLAVEVAQNVFFGFENHIAVFSLDFGIAEIEDCRKDFSDFVGKNVVALHGVIHKTVLEDFRHNLANIAAEVFRKARHRHNYVHEQIRSNHGEMSRVAFQKRKLLLHDVVNFAFLRVFEAFNERVVFL